MDKLNELCDTKDTDNKHDLARSKALFVKILTQSVTHIMDDVPKQVTALKQLNTELKKESFETVDDVCEVLWKERNNKAMFSRKGNGLAKLVGAAIGWWVAALMDNQFSISAALGDSVYYELDNKTEKLIIRLYVGERTPEDEHAIAFCKMYSYGNANNPHLAEYCHGLKDDFYYRAFRSFKTAFLNYIKKKCSDKGVKSPNDINYLEDIPSFIRTTFKCRVQGKFTLARNVIGPYLGYRLANIFTSPNSKLEKHLLGNSAK